MLKYKKTYINNNNATHKTLNLLIRKQERPLEVAKSPRERLAEWLKIRHQPADMQEKWKFLVEKENLSHKFSFSSRRVM